MENTPASVQEDNTIQQFLKQVGKFGLTKLEKIMLLNLRPATAVEISLVYRKQICQHIMNINMLFFNLQIVQSAEQERLTEEQVEELLQIIQSTLPEITK